MHNYKVAHEPLLHSPLPPFPPLLLRLQQTLVLCPAHACALFPAQSHTAQGFHHCVAHYSPGVVATGGTDMPQLAAAIASANTMALHRCDIHGYWFWSQILEWQTSSAVARSMASWSDCGVAMLNNMWSIIPWVSPSWAQRTGDLGDRERAIKRKTCRRPGSYKEI